MRKTILTVFFLNTV